MSFQATLASPPPVDAAAAATARRAAPTPPPWPAPWPALWRPRWSCGSWPRAAGCSSGRGKPRAPGIGESRGKLPGRITGWRAICHMFLGYQPYELKWRCSVGMGIVICLAGSTLRLKSWKLWVKYFFWGASWKKIGVAIKRVLDTKTSCITLVSWNVSEVEQRRSWQVCRSKHLSIKATAAIRGWKAGCVAFGPADSARIPTAPGCIRSALPPVARATQHWPQQRRSHSVQQKEAPRPSFRRERIPTPIDRFCLSHPIAPFFKVSRSQLNRNPLFFKAWGCNFHHGEKNGEPPQFRTRLQLERIHFYGTDLHFCWITSMLKYV